MKIAVIRYNAGNIHSVRIALQRLGVDPIVTGDTNIIRSADKIIFPGVGEASSAMAFIRAKGIAELLPGLRQPVLGICLGMQLMCKYSEENDTECLGIFQSAVKKFPPRNKVPHMGWNTISGLKSNLFKGITTDVYVYFVHSYYAEKSANSTAVSEYILPFSAALQKNNFNAVQFHPEKSGPVGERILRNFLAL
jgi:glutamine amidotransferase